MSDAQTVTTKGKAFKVLAVFVIAFMLQGMSLVVFDGERPAEANRLKKGSSAASAMMVNNVFTVTTIEDGGPGSLREIMSLANEIPGPDAIRFAFADPVTITLFSPLPTIFDPLSIDGQEGGWLTHTHAIDGSNLSGDLFVIRSAPGSEIRNLRMIAPPDGYGISMIGNSQGSSVITSTITGGMGGVNIDDPLGFYTVTHSVFEGQRIAAILAKSSAGLWIAENLIRTTGAAGIRLMDGISRTNIFSNTFIGGFEIGRRGIESLGGSWMTVTNNSFSRFADAGIHVEGGHHLMFNNNTITDTFGAGIRLLKGVKSTTVFSNSVSTERGIGSRGVHLAGAGPWMTVTNNTFAGMADAGVFVDGGGQLLMMNNALDRIGNSGFRLENGVRNAIVISNTISGLPGRSSFGITASGTPPPTGIVMRGNWYTDTVPITLGPGANNDFPAPAAPKAVIHNDSLWILMSSPADPFSYTYPLSMDLYRVRDGNYTPTGPSALYTKDDFPNPVTYTLSLKGIDEGDQVAIIATTANPNTSQFSRPIVVVPPTGDDTPPECRMRGIDPGPPTMLHIVVGDRDSGLDRINVVKANNATVSFPRFTPGTNDPVEVVATKIDQSKRSTVVLEIADVAGNKTKCDPVVTTVVSETPEEFSLGANYPNPFNPRTTITIALPEEMSVHLAVFDVLGRHVTTLVDDVLGAGRHEVVWDAQDVSGRELPSGLYLYRIEAGDFVEERSMVLLR